MTHRVVESGCKQVPCPCGCGLSCEQHDGSIHFGGGGVFFRALLMREAGGLPNVWLSIASAPPAGSAGEPTWLVALHGNQEGARIEDSASSPVAIDPGFVGRHLRREELLAMPDAMTFYFDCFDALMAQHSRIPTFVLG